MVKSCLKMDQTRATLQPLAFARSLRTSGLSLYPFLLPDGLPLGEGELAAGDPHPLIAAADQAHLDPPLSQRVVVMVPGCSGRNIIPRSRLIRRSGLPLKATISQ